MRPQHVRDKSRFPAILLSPVFGNLGSAAADPHVSKQFGLECRRVGVCRWFQSRFTELQTQNDAVSGSCAPREERLPVSDGCVAK